MSVFVILYILFAHWISDFILQFKWMADNKSKQITPLLAHTELYSLSMGIFILILVKSNVFMDCGWVGLFKFITAMFVTHTIIDFVTSKVTNYLWVNKKVRTFFDTVGLDQWLHYATIFLTINYLYY